MQRRQAHFHQNLVEHPEFRLALLAQPVAHGALGDPDAFGEIFLRDLQLTHPGFDQVSPFIHRWHDTDCLLALNTHIVVFKQ
ncbi:hypothetical protein D3C76_1108700 [compost metagenome]